MKRTPQTVTSLPTFRIGKIKVRQMLGGMGKVSYFCSVELKTKGELPRPKCFHNGIILIVNCFKSEAKIERNIESAK